MITLYIEKNVIIDDYWKEKRLIKALSAFSKLPSDITISIVMNNVDNDLSWLEEYFSFIKFDKNFTELVKSFEFITKDETYISYDIENLFKWDYHRGKAILVQLYPYCSDNEMFFNKISLKSTEDEILNRLRSYIHI